MDLISIEQTEVVLNRLREKKPNEFSSHDFIEEYCAQYETAYLDWLYRYRGTNRAFWKVHQLIGNYLSRNEGKRMPLYRRTHRADSENVHGMIDRPMWREWEWKNSE